MSKEKQIEEMARVWCALPDRHDCKGCCKEGCYEISKSEMLYNAGYRKQSEVAREICCKIEEEIVAALESNYRARKEHIERHAELAYDTELLLEINGKINALRGIEGFVEELKKKYAEAEK